jgi:formamidopyrimidine-DNA glycosylase
MPELPEVETRRRGIAPHVCGPRVARIARRRHDHVDIVLEDGTLLRDRDPRRFGAMLWAAHDASSHPLLEALVPEPFAEDFDADYLWRTTRTRHAAIKLVLMDNHGVRDVLTEAIAKGGSTLRDYVGSDGSAGHFQLAYFVDGKAGATRRVCGTPIRQARQGARSTFYCPNCQR